MRAYLHAAGTLRERASCNGAAACVADDALDAGVEALRATAVAFLPVRLAALAALLCCAEHSASGFGSTTQLPKRQ